MCACKHNRATAAILRDREGPDSLTFDFKHFKFITNKDTLQSISMFSRLCKKKNVPKTVDGEWDGILFGLILNFWYCLKEKMFCTLTCRTVFLIY